MDDGSVVPPEGVSGGPIMLEVFNAIHKRDMGYGEQLLS